MAKSKTTDTDKEKAKKTGTKKTGKRPAAAKKPETKDPTVNKSAGKTTTKTKKGSSAPQPPEVSEDDIRKKAHEIYMQRGGTEGSSDEDWLQAERELKRERENKK